MIKILALLGVITQFIILDFLITCLYLTNRKWAESLAEAIFRPIAGFYLAISIAGLKISLKIHHEQPQEPPPMIILANHQSLLDILALIYAFPQCSLRFIGKIQLQSFFPLISTMLRIQQHVLVDRSNIKKNATNHIEKTIAQLVQKSPASRAIVIFPEGTRSRDGRVLPFRSGALRTIIQQNPNLPLLPVAIEGGYKVATFSDISMAKKRFTYHLSAGKLQYPKEGGWKREELLAALGNCREQIVEKITHWRSAENINQ